MGNELDKRQDASRVAAATNTDRDVVPGKPPRPTGTGGSDQIRLRILALRAAHTAASNEGVQLLTRLLPRPDAVLAVEGFLVTGAVIRDRGEALKYLSAIEALADDGRRAYDAAIKNRGGAGLDAVLAAARAPAQPTGDTEITDAEAMRNRQLIDQRRRERDARIADRKVDKPTRRERAFEAWVQEHAQNYYGLPPGQQAALRAEWDKTEGKKFAQREQQIEDAARLSALRARLLRPPIEKVTLSASNPVTAVVARGAKRAPITRGTYDLPVADPKVAREFFALAKHKPESDPEVTQLVNRYAADVRSSWAQIVGKTLDQRYDAAALEKAAAITPEILLQYARPADVAVAKQQLNPLRDDGSVDMDSPAWAYEICGQPPPDGRRRPGLVAAGPKGALYFRARFAGYLGDRAWAARTGQTIDDSVYAGDVGKRIKGITEDDIYKLLGKVLTVNALLTVVSPKQQTELLVAIEDKKTDAALPDLTETQQLDFERKAVGNQPLVTADGTQIPLGSANLNQQRVMTAKVEAQRLATSETTLRTTVDTDTKAIGDLQNQIDSINNQIAEIGDRKLGEGPDEYRRLHEQQESLKRRRGELEARQQTLKQTLANDQGQLAFTEKYRSELAAATPESVGALDRRLADEVARIDARRADTQAKLDALRKKGVTLLPVDPRGGPEERSAAGGAALANGIAEENFRTQEAAYLKDLAELDTWRGKLTGYQRNNQLGAVTTGTQLDQGALAGTNQDRWMSIQGRIGYAALAGGEEALAFVIRVLAGIVDYSIPGLAEKGGNAVASALGADPKNLPGGVTWAAAQMRNGAADLERRAADNMAATGGGWDVEIIKGVVEFLVLYLPTMGFGGAGAAIGRAVSAARYAELLGTSVGLATMGALATVGESWDAKLKTIVPLALMPAIGAKLGGIGKVPVRLAATFIANAATDVLAQSDLVAAGRAFAETGNIKQAITVAGAKVNFQKALTNGLLAVAMEAHGANKSAKAARAIENEMPVLEYAPAGDAGPRSYLRLSIEGERRVWKELPSKPATGQRVLRIEQHEYAVVKNAGSPPEAVLDVLNRAATRGDVLGTLDDLAAYGTQKLARTKDANRRAELTGAIERVGELKGLVGKVGKRDNLTLDEVKTARAMLGDAAMGYAEIGTEVVYRQDVYDFQRELAARAGTIVEGSRRTFEAKQVEYDKVCKALEKIEKQSGPEIEAQRKQLQAQRQALGDEVVGAQQQAIAKTREMEAEIASSTASFEATIGGRIKFTDEPRTVEDTRLAAERLARTGPGQTPAQAEAELAKYNARQDQIADSYAKVQSGELQHPNTTAERLKLAVEGDANGERIPLNFKDADQFHEFQRELQAVLSKHGITDAVIQQLGSGTTGWRGNPNKEFAPWKPTSDVDFAIFSDQLLKEALAVDAEVNDKIAQGGKFTVLRNKSKVGGKGFYDTPVGKDLDALAKRWNERIYGDPDIDGFDFKLNLSDQPFSRAVNVIQNEPVRPLGGAQVMAGAGANQYFGVPVGKPKMAGRISEAIVENRESHLTIFEPEEWAALPEAARQELAAGVRLAGAPEGTGMIKRGDQGWYLMTVTWPEVDALRAKYGLPPKQLHVTVGKASGVTENKPVAPEMPEVEADDGT